MTDDRPSPTPGSSLRGLLAADYGALYAGRFEAEAGSGRRALVRFLINPSLHAVVLMRAALAGPDRLMGLWRHLLLSKHSIDLERGCELGPRLILPHPFGILISAGVRVGSGVTLYHNVTLGGPTKEGCRPPVIGDGVVIHTNSLVCAGAVVEAGAIIGANSLVDGHIPAGAVFRKGAVA